MAKRFLTERVVDLRALSAVKATGLNLPYTPLELGHVYVNLEFAPGFENAATADEAKGFLRSVARASTAAHLIASQYGGLVLEVQGSTLHVGLEGAPGSTPMDRANAFVNDLHWAYRALFHDQQKRVRGWRMTVDTGKTLVVIGRGVHNDDSYVSLGRSANRPAKHLYAQLAIEQDDHRDLKRFHVAIRRPISANDVWDHFDLDRSKSRLAILTKIVEEARQAEPKLTFIEALAGRKQVSARALPLGPAGSPASPSPDRPHTYFGWVMRADLDGFTARVEGCFDNDEKLRELGEQFYCIMDAATEFTQAHKEELAQLPWAGDNFTAAAVFSERPEYDAAVPKRIVDLTLDFEKEMAQAALECGTGGWAHGVAGGVVHGNAGGNVYLAGVEIDGRRFLVGVGEGFGRSNQAFTDISPRAKQIVLYKDDWEKLQESYKKSFEPAVNVRGEQSTLYRISNADALTRVRAREASAVSFTTLEFQGEPSRTVPTKPHYR